MPNIYYPLDQRFWLITSVVGHLSDEEIPLMQERLANIYRIAFTKYDLMKLNWNSFNPHSMNKIE